MDKRRLESVVSLLGHSELTFLEKRFLERVKEYFEKHGQLTEQQQSILEGICREKVRWMRKDAQRERAYTAKGPP